MEEEKIISFIANQLDPKEREDVLQWISESPENREEYYKLKNTWALTAQFDSSTEVKESDIIIFQKNIRKGKRKIYKIKALSTLKYAAVAVIALFVGKFLFTMNGYKDDNIYNEITVPAGQMAQVSLSDGTIVFINSCSSLKYPAKFTSDERRVLLSGEAFFNVKAGKKPFMVEANNKTIRVTGTKFNVMAYPTDRYYQATLIEGKITLLEMADRNSVELKPGEQYTYDSKDKTYTIKKVRTNIFDSWKEGIYIFDHETLGGIAERLERVFAVTIHIENEKIRNYKFTGTISRNIPFEQILKVIQITAPIRYKLEERNGAIKEVYLY